MSRRLVAKDPASNRSPLRRIAVVLPAWQPDRHLTQLATDLTTAGFHHLVVVDDGSAAASQPLFDTLRALPQVTVCRHPSNRGKGCALKTAFRHILDELPEISGVVTADADGQHTPRDIVRVARRLLRSPERTVLGVRTLGAGVPWRSRLGNLATRYLFAMLCGRLLRDTQTGLRGLPRPLLPSLLQLPGERYEHEIVVLAALCRRRTLLTQLPIKTVYLQGNRGSHFRPLRDSVRVYLALLRFACTPAPRRRPRPLPADKGRLHPA